MAHRPDASRPGQTSPASADPVGVAAEIARLDALDLGALRVAFRNRTGRLAPARIAKVLLFRVLAYRIQADAYGNLRPETRRLFDRIAASAGAGTPEAGTPAVPARDVPKRGTVLVREWQGRMEHVMVLEQGFAWNGNTYVSLSAVALAITGTKWNGRRFFGLDLKENGRHRSGAGEKRGGESKAGLEQSRNGKAARRGAAVPPAMHAGPSRPSPSHVLGPLP